MVVRLRFAGAVWVCRSDVVSDDVVVSILSDPVCSRLAEAMPDVFFDWLCFLYGICCEKEKQTG